NELTRLGTEWKKISKKKQEILSQTYNPEEIESHCPTCKQELSKEVIESKSTELKDSFNKAIKTRLNQADSELEQNQTVGKSIREKVDQAIKDKELAEKELSEKKITLEKLQKELEQIVAKLNEPQPEPDYAKHLKYNELIESIEQLQTEL